MTPLSFGKPFLLVSEAAGIARCSIITVRRAIRARRLAVHRPNGKRGRTLIAAADLESWLSRSRIGAVGENRKQQAS